METRHFRVQVYPWFRDRRNRFIAKNFLLFLWTGILIAFTFAVIKFYERLNNFSENKKKGFEGIFGALILLLGLSVFDAFKTLAREAPVFMLGHSRYAYKHTLSREEREERELIEKVEDWFNVFKLARVASLDRPGKPRKPLIVVACVAWACLFLATQTAVALTNIGAQTVDGTDFTNIYINSHSLDVNFPNMTCYQSWDLAEGAKCPLDGTPGQRDQGAFQFIAHSYGLSGPTRGQGSPVCRGYQDTSDILSSAGVTDDPRYGNYIPPYYCRRDAGKQEFAYRFLEYNPQDNSSTYPFFTNRIITASSGPCVHYSFVSSNRAGMLTNYTIKADGQDTTTTLRIAEQNEALSGTTYVYDGIKLPPDADDTEHVVCGPRCVLIWAHLLPPLHAPGPNSFFKCPITVDAVTNASDPAHEFSDAIARFAAASIGLSGRPREPTGADYNWKQSQFFAYGTPWSLLEDDGPDKLDEVGAKMAEFAIRSIATLAQRNPRILIEGSQPVLGKHLEIHWGLLSGIGGSILLVRFLLFLAILYVGRWSPAASPVSRNEGHHGLDVYPSSAGLHSAASHSPPPAYGGSESRRGLVQESYSRRASEDHSLSDDDFSAEITHARESF